MKALSGSKRLCGLIIMLGVLTSANSSVASQQALVNISYVDRSAVTSFTSNTTITRTFIETRTGQSVPVTITLNSAAFPTIMWPANIVSGGRYFSLIPSLTGFAS